jgi:hypothetical protein
MKCCAVPNAMLEFAGETARDTSVAGVTVSVVDPETLPSTATIVVEPAAAEVAIPLEPAVLLMVAAAVTVDDQVTDAVKS